MVQPLGYNDGILLVSLLYSSIDLQFEWDSFSTCNRPIHMWLLTSYVCVIMFRLTHLLGMRSTSNQAGDFFAGLEAEKLVAKDTGSVHVGARLALLRLLDTVGDKMVVERVQAHT